MIEFDIFLRSSLNTWKGNTAHVFILSKRCCRVVFHCQSRPINQKNTFLASNSIYFPIHFTLFQYSLVFHDRSLIFFFTGGKKCPACKQVIYHDRWKVTPKLAEERWAHHEAKKRELSEVVDFLGDCLWQKLLQFYMTNAEQNCSKITQCGSSRMVTVDQLTDTCRIR